MEILRIIWWARAGEFGGALLLLNKYLGSGSRTLEDLDIVLEDLRWTYFLRTGFCGLQEESYVCVRKEDCVLFMRILVRVLRAVSSFWLNTFKNMEAGVMRVLFCLRGHLWLEDKPRSRIKS